MSDFDALEFAEVQVPPPLAAQMPGQSAADPPAIAAAMGQTFGKLMAFHARSQTHGLHLPTRLVARR
jgi:hypothetical protein